MTEFVVSGLIYAGTLLALMFICRGVVRRLVTIGYGFLALFAFQPMSMLMASALALALALWLRRVEDLD